MSIDSATAYETHALEFLRARDHSTIGTAVLQVWCASLSPNAEVLELACGAGFPVTSVLHEVGLQIWAIDSSPTLLAHFQERFPSIPVACARVQDSTFFSKQFDAVLAIGLLFLLDEADQLALIQRLATHLKLGGRLLFTAPLQACQWRDASTGLLSHSLGQDAYVACLQAHGFAMIGHYVDEGENHYYEAQRVI
ncbi:class I SAM-dependent methyltransferase [Undibacterium danionis]|uniref:Class I SAM-dependent methyltransferase n=1 Tax=Undibacterium danionis TaxID=1812100 RepID=A0ABV6IBV7_9BURK